MFDEDGRKIDLDTPRPRNLEGKSVEDMQAYIGWLETEIARVKETIAERDATKSAADAFFN
tara:strand:- start:3356 stop:3538 length:183 start_codon:yes stop_codon:yes gene_type:complete